VVDGLLAYASFMINKLSTAVDRIIPRDEDDPATTPFVMVPSDAQFNTNPLEPRHLHTPFPVPSLWLWWPGTSQSFRATAAHRARRRQLRMLYVFDELPDDEFVSARSNLAGLIDSELFRGSDNQWQSGFSYDGGIAGQSLVAQIGAKFGLGHGLSHDMIDWEYMGGRDVPRIGAYDANQEIFADKDSGRDFPGFVGVFEVVEKVDLSRGTVTLAELQDSVFSMNGPQGVPIMDGVAQHPDGGAAK